MARTGKVRVDITADASGVKRGTQDAERSLERLNRSGTRAMRGLGRAAAIAGTAIAGGLVVGITKATNAASDLEEAVNKSAQTFERSAPAMEKWASTAATSLGMSKQAALENAASIGAMLKPMGVAPQRAADMSRAMVQLAGDMASFNNEDPSEMLDRIRAGLSGESEPLKRFGAVLSETRVQQHAWNTGMVESGEKLTEQQKIMARYSLLLKDTADQQGDFARTSDGMANSQRIARAQFEDLSAQIGRVFLPAMVKVLGVVNDVLQWAQRNWPRFRKFTEDAFDGARAVVQRAMDWINANVVPTIRAIVAAARRFWDRFGDDIAAVFNFVVRTIRRAMIVAREVIELALAVIRGDWGEAWKSLKTIVSTAFKGILDFLRTIPRQLLALGRDMGEAIVDGIMAGLRSVGGQITDFLWGLIPGPLRGFFDGSSAGARSQASAIAGFGGAGGGLRRASGGFIPGQFDARDDVPVRLSRGEVVLNPTQQRIVGIDRIVGALRRTGGVVGGDSFAVGGVVGGGWQAASEFARRQVGEPYVWGGGHSFGDSHGWDCSGFASNVAARVPGYTGGIGTTMTLYPRSKPARGNEPVVFGFSGMETNDPRKQHMGIRVGGVWYDAGSGGVEVGRTRWPSGLRIPPGLEYLSNETGGGGGGGPDPGPRLAPDKETPLQRVTRLLGATGLVRDNTKAAGAIGRRLLAGVPDLSEGAAPGLNTRQERVVGKAGRQARAAARAAGRSPEEVARAGEEAERQQEITFLRKQVADAQKDLKALTRLKGRTLRDFRKLGRKKVRTAKARAAKKALMAQYRRKLADITDEITEVREEIAQINERLMEIGEQIAQEQYEENYDTGAQEATGADSTAAEPAGPSPDQVAQMAQAEQRAQTAQRSQAISDSVLRTLFNSGTIDPLGGSINVTINTLHPGDPAIQGEVARWVVGALGGQGSVPASAFASGA